MMTAQSNRRSTFGVNCVQCGDLLIAPDWSEYRDEQHVLNLWFCAKCGCQFETEALIPSIPEAVIRAFFPSLLVA